MYRIKDPFSKQCIRLITIAMMVLGLSGCIGTLVGAVVDTAIEVVKIPFKVGGAIIDVATPDDESSNMTDSADSLDNGESNEQRQEGLR